MSEDQANYNTGTVEVRAAINGVVVLPRDYEGHVISARPVHVFNNSDDFAKHMGEWFRRNVKASGFAPNGEG